MSDTAQEIRDLDAGADEPRRGVLRHVERLGRLANENRLLAALVGVGFLAGLGAILSVAAFFWTSQAEPATLEEALAALDAGFYSQARQVGERLVYAGRLPADSLGGPQFVIGAAVAHEADRTGARDKKTQYRLSSRYLEEARDLGFPPDRRGEGLFLLGRSLLLGGQVSASRQILREALELAPRHRLEILWLLGEAHLGDADPDYPEALAANEQYLADRAMLPADRRRGLLQRARILLGLKETQQALATLGQIPENSPEQADALVIRVGVLMAEADGLLAGAEPDSDRHAAGLKKYDEAIALLDTAQRGDALGNQASREAMYLAGVCLLRKAEFKKALEQFAVAARANPGSEEALAAEFESAELLRTLGQHKEAVAAYGRALAAGDCEGYGNRWISLADLRRRGLLAYEDWLEGKSFDLALLMAEKLAPILPPAGAIELAARAHAAWGREMLAAEATANDFATQQAAGREHLRRAGAGYAALAKARTATEHYAEDLWQSAECCLQGRDHAGAAAALREFLNSGPRQRHPQALVELGETQLNLGRTDEALKSLRECIEVYPRDASAYRARLIASRAHAEKGEMPEAEAMLNANLDGHLTPDSIEWRGSLLALGDLLCRQRRYQEAAERLAEAIRRYPDDPESINARYLLAECHRAEAERLRKELGEERVESVRRTNLRRVGECLTLAIEGYSFIRQALNQRQEEQPLSSIERKTLRNCYFALGAAWFDLGDYEQANRAYTAAATRYQNEPEALEAYVQIARAHRRLNDPEEARVALQQGQEVLKRLKHRAEFLHTTNSSAQEWETMFDWLKTL